MTQKLITITVACHEQGQDDVERIFYASTSYEIQNAMLEAAKAAFAFMPKRVEQAAPRTVINTSPKRQATGEPTAKLESNDRGGYNVLARFNDRGKYKIVEQLPTHSQAKLLCEQFERDDQMRHEALAEVRDFDFVEDRIAVPRERKEREPRAPKARFSFVD